MKKAFVPICLYCNGFFLIKEQVLKFLRYYSYYDEILFVIVDKLYGINLLIKEKVCSIEAAHKAYEKRGQDIFFLIQNCIRNFISIDKPSTNFIIKKWNELAETSDYVDLKNTIISEFKNNVVLNKHCEKFIEENLARVTNRIDVEKKCLEHEYLFSEVAMSIYLTEFCGYTDEIWEKKQADSMEDPINLLYRNENESLNRIIGKKVGKRCQLYLSSMI